MTRDEVLKEFYATPAVPGGASDRMADEIVRLRALVSALWQQRFTEAAMGKIFDNAGEPEAEALRHRLARETPDA